MDHPPNLQRAFLAARFALGALCGLLSILLWSLVKPIDAPIWLVALLSGLGAASYTWWRGF